MAAASTNMKTTWELSEYTTAKWMASGTLKIQRRKPDVFGKPKKQGHGYIVYVKPATCQAILEKRDEIRSTMNDMMQQDDPEPTNIHLWGNYVLQLSVFLRDGLECPYYGIHKLDEDQCVVVGAGLNLKQAEYDAFLKMLVRWKLYLTTSTKMCDGSFTNDGGKKKRKNKDVVQLKKNQGIENCGTQTDPRLMEDFQNLDSDDVVPKKKQCTANCHNQTVPGPMEGSQYPEGISPISDDQLDQFTDLLKPDDTYTDVIPPMELASAKKQTGTEQFSKQFSKDQTVDSTVKVYASKSHTGDIKPVGDVAQDMKKTKELVNQTDQVSAKKQAMEEITDLMKEEAEIMKLMKKETEPMKEEAEQVVKQTDQVLSSKVQEVGGADSKISRKIGVTLFGWEWCLVKDDGSIELLGKPQGDFFVDPKMCVSQAMQNKPKYGNYKMNTITRKVHLPINQDLLDAALGRLVQLRQYHHKKLGMPEGHPTAESTILGSISFAEIYDLCRKAIQLYQSVTELDMSHLMELLSEYKKDYNIFYLLKHKFLNKYFVQLFEFLKW
jgi:hypothetical protein